MSQYEYECKVWNMMQFFSPNEFLFLSLIWCSFASGQLSMRRTSAENSRTHFPQTLRFLCGWNI